MKAKEEDRVRTERRKWFSRTCRDLLWCVLHDFPVPLIACSPWSCGVFSVTFQYLLWRVLHDCGVFSMTFQYLLWRVLHDLVVCSPWLSSTSCGLFSMILWCVLNDFPVLLVVCSPWSCYVFSMTFQYLLWCVLHDFPVPLVACSPWSCGVFSMTFHTHSLTSWPSSMRVGDSRWPLLISFFSIVLDLVTSPLAECIRTLQCRVSVCPLSSRSSLMPWPFHDSF